MDKLMMAAPAKINLSLDILGRRPDGYHAVDMMMARVSLYDTVTAERTAAGIEVACDKLTVPSGRDNIAYQAAETFFSAMGITGGVRILIKKIIPQAAGLAGGSADAAAVLQLLNHLYGTRLTNAYLEKMAVRVGADVPYCLYTSFARVSGIGEKIHFISGALFLPIVIVKPPVSVATGWAYEQTDSRAELIHPATDAVCAAVEKSDRTALFSAMDNSFEAVIEAQYPEVAAAKKALVNVGAQRVMMSGSGPSVFGIFVDGAAAEKAALQLREQGQECYACETLS